ncbi:Hint domain-containing protein [Moraxella oblonga]|uniref:Hint domain-containing protein n=1 Tax=Moraxella oblonga TaxID=200413 RepID=UPI00083577B2|nr:Hint domain-containing protein [Moraxella oblonga]
MSNQGFPAGTLVHTDKGLVPIQEIKVGDMVLSKAEDGSGETTYKPVISTFKSAYKEKIYKVEYFNESADKRGEKGKNYIFCNALHPFYVTKKPTKNVNNQLEGEWLAAEDLPAGHLVSVSGDVISLDDYAYLPVRTLPNYPTGCAYVQSIDHHGEGWNGIENVEFVRFDTDGYHFISLADSAEGYQKEIATLNTKTSDSILHLNQNSPFLIDVELYKTLNVRLNQDLDPEIHTTQILSSIMYSPMIVNGRIVRENRIVNEELFKKALDNITKYGSNAGLSDISLHEQVSEYYDAVVNSYEDYVYNFEVADYHTYFVGHDGIWVHNTNGCFSEDELLDNLNNEGFMRSPEAKAFHGESMPVTTKDEILAGTKPVTKGKKLYHSAYVSADAQKILNLNPSHYADLATDKENPLSGEALNKKIYDEAFDVNELKLETKHDACFVAGTLVHTDKGLVPIEKLKVGDMVLSRHENEPEGELAYKRILSTFKSKEKEKIIYVDYLTERGSGYFFCTENHPFWIDTLIEHKILEDGKEVITRDAIGWEQAIELDGCSRHSLRTSDGKIAYVNTFGDDNKILGTLPRLPNYVLIFNTEEAIGVIDFGGDYPIVLDGKGTQLNSLTSISTSTLMETEKKRLIINSQDAEEYEKLIKAGISYEKIYEAYVYNIEVEDYHTYFVGDTGIWVRDKS